MAQDGEEDSSPPTTSNPTLPSNNSPSAATFSKPPANIPMSPSSYRDRNSCNDLPMSPINYYHPYGAVGQPHPGPFALRSPTTPSVPSHGRSMTKNNLSRRTIRPTISASLVSSLQGHISRLRLLLDLLVTLIAYPLSKPSRRAFRLDRNSTK